MTSGASAETKNTALVREPETFVIRRTAAFGTRDQEGIARSLMTPRRRSANAGDLYFLEMRRNERYARAIGFVRADPSSRQPLLLLSSSSSGVSAQRPAYPTRLIQDYVHLASSFTLECERPSMVMASIS
jgi:hypothetical protein